MLDVSRRAVHARIIPRLYGNDPAATDPNELEDRRERASKNREAAIYDRGDESERERLAETILARLALAAGTSPELLSWALLSALAPDLAALIRRTQG